MCFTVDFFLLLKPVDTLTIITFFVIYLNIYCFLRDWFWRWWFTFKNNTGRSIHDENVRDCFDFWSTDVVFLMRSYLRKTSWCCSCGCRVLYLLEWDCGANWGPFGPQRLYTGRSWANASSARSLSLHRIWNRQGAGSELPHRHTIVASGIDRFTGRRGPVHIKGVESFNAIRKIQCYLCPTSLFILEQKYKR